MLKISIKYALICGVFITIIYHLSFLFNSNPLIDLSHLLFDLILFGLFIFFAEKEYKTYHGQGVFHFWQGMTMGFIVYTVATILFVGALIIYFQFSEDAVRNYQEAATHFLNERAEMYREQFGEAGLQEQMDEIRDVTMWDLVQSSALKKILAGFFITPVISIILRKQPK